VPKNNPQKELALSAKLAQERHRLAQSEIESHYDWIIKNLKDGRSEVAMAMHLINVRKCKAISVSDIRNLISKIQ
jgi:hypothetical protein